MSEGPPRRSEGGPGRRGGTAALALGALVALALLLATAIRPVWTIDPDASLYVSLGRALAAGDGYALDGVPHTKYPPGLPALLAVVVAAAGPEAYAGFHAVLVAALVLATGLSWCAARRLGCPPVACLVVAGAVACSQTLFDLAIVYVRTEPLFLALTVGALLAFWRARDGAHPAAGAAGDVGGASTGAPSLGRAAWAAALVAAAISVRLAGVALLVVPAWTLLRPGGAGRRGGAALVLLAGLAAFGAWQARAAHVAATHPGAIDYSTEFRAAEPRDLAKVVREDMPALDGPGLVRRVAGNADVMVRAMAVLLTNTDRAGARRPVGVLLTLLVGWGVLAWLRRPGPPRDAALYVLATVGLYLVWPFNQQERFYVPLLPLLVVAAGLGARAAWAAAGTLLARPGGRAVLLAGGVAVLLLLALQRSDQPVLLGRWSRGYAALLAAGVAGWIALAILTRRGRLPALRPALALLALLLWLAPFAHARFLAWPARVAAFEARRVADPQPGALARIEVDPRLERVAVYLRDETPPDTVMMTDVPQMLQVMSGRRCVPFVYRVEPPEVLVGDADLVFYTRELPEAAAVMDAVAPRLRPVLELEPVFDGTRTVTPTVYDAR